MICTRIMYILSCNVTSVSHPQPALDPLLKCPDLFVFTSCVCFLSKYLRHLRQFKRFTRPRLITSSPLSDPVASRGVICTAQQPEMASASGAHFSKENAHSVQHIFLPSRSWLFCLRESWPLDINWGKFTTQRYPENCSYISCVITVIAKQRITSVFLAELGGEWQWSFDHEGLSLFS